MAWAEILPQLAWAWLAAAAAMAGLWVVAVRIRDAGVVDVGWAACVGAMAVGYAIAGSGHVGQRAAVAAVGGTWGLRLALHLLRDRVLGKPEDGRYQALRAHWGRRADAHFAWFFQLQALLAAALSLPFALASSIAAPPLLPVQVLGVAAVAGGVACESVADRQLASFRADPAHRGRTCRRGLWRYSRHPNYFGEWVAWCGFALLATPALHGAWAWSAPAAILVLVTRVTGIPYTEAQALRSRGDDYRRYQQTTNAFFPGPPTPPREEPAP